MEGRELPHESSCSENSNFPFPQQIKFPPRKRQRRNQRVKKACLNCRSSHVACSAIRPCLRCVEKNLECIDEEENSQNQTSFNHQQNQYFSYHQHHKKFYHQQQEQQQYHQQQQYQQQQQQQQQEEEEEEQEQKDHEIEKDFYHQYLGTRSDKKFTDMEYFQVEGEASLENSTKDVIDSSSLSSLSSSSSSKSTLTSTTLDSNPSIRDRYICPVASENLFTPVQVDQTGDISLQNECKHDYLGQNLDIFLFQTPPSSPSDNSAPTSHQSTSITNLPTYQEGKKESEDIVPPASYISSLTPLPSSSLSSSSLSSPSLSSPSIPGSTSSGCSSSELPTYSLSTNKSDTEIQLLETRSDLLQMKNLFIEQQHLISNLFSKLQSATYGFDNIRDSILVRSSPSYPFFLPNFESHQKHEYLHLKHTNNDIRENCCNKGSFLIPIHLLSTAISVWKYKTWQFMDCNTGFLNLFSASSKSEVRSLTINDCVPSQLRPFIDILAGILFEKYPNGSPIFHKLRIKSIILDLNGKTKNLEEVIHLDFAHDGKGPIWMEHFEVGLLDDEIYIDDIRIARTEIFKDVQSMSRKFCTIVANIEKVKQERLKSFLDKRSP